MRQSNLLLHFLSMVKFVVRSFGVKEWLSRKCLPIEEEVCLCSSTRWCKRQSPFSQIRLSRMIGLMKHMAFTSRSRTLSISLEVQPRTNFFYLTGNFTSRQIVSRWAPPSDPYWPMFSCVALKKPWSVKARCPLTIRDTWTTLKLLCLTNYQLLIFLWLVTIVNLPSSSLWRSRMTECFRFLGHNCWINLLKFRPKSMSNPQTLAFCFITRAMLTFATSAAYWKPCLTVPSASLPTGPTFPRNVIGWSTHCWFLLHCYYMTRRICGMKQVIIVAFSCWLPFMFTLLIVSFLCYITIAFFIFHIAFEALLSLNAQKNFQE